MKLIWITEAKYVNGYKIDIQFNDGTKGIVDLKDSLDAEIFKPLKNIDYFKTFNKNAWTIEWDCEVDFSPEYLYEFAVKESERTQQIQV